MKVTFLAIFLTVGCPVAGFAEHQGSLEDQMACTPDVYKLCSNFVPDENKIVACLERNVANLSRACQKVFSKPDPAAPKSPDDDDD